jgi:hypothetical protein
MVLIASNLQTNAAEAFSNSDARFLRESDARFLRTSRASISSIPTRAYETSGRLNVFDAPYEDSSADEPEKTRKSDKGDAEPGSPPAVEL